MFFARYLVCLLLGGLMWSSVGLAVPQAAADNSAENVATAERIDELIKQLNGDRYAEREAAMKALIDIGQPAIEAVDRAATAGSLEVTSRSIDILKKLYESSDEATKAAAEAALKQLAEGDHPPSARRAKTVIKPKQPAGQGASGAGRVIIGGAQFNIQGGNRQISVKTINGVKTIEVNEPEKKTKIVEDPQKGITAEITTKKDGKEKTEKIAAKNADDLKKKNKDAYDICREFRMNNNIQIREFGNLGGRAVPLPGGRAVPIQPQRARVDMVASLLKSWAQQIPRMTGENELKNAPKESLDELQKQVAAAKSQLADLEKRIQASAEAAKAAAEKDADEPEAKDDANEDDGAGDSETPAEPSE